MKSVSCQFVIKEFFFQHVGHKVLIAAADTFRAGAVEQLRTHTKHLNALHANSVQLYEQGYGKDPAGLAAAAISIGSFFNGLSKFDLNYNFYHWNC